MDGTRIVGSQRADGGDPMASEIYITRYTAPPTGCRYPRHLTKSEIKAIIDAQRWIELNDNRFGQERLIRRLLQIIARLTR